MADNMPLSWKNVERRKHRIGFALCPSDCHVESGLGGVMSGILSPKEIH